MTELICISCPRGCHLKVDNEMNVTGNFCPRGKVYAINELTNPKRMITTTVNVVDGEISRLSVASSEAVPKNMIFQVVEEIKKHEVKAPVNIGDVIVHNILDLGVDIIATKSIEKIASHND